MYSNKKLWCYALYFLAGVVFAPTVRRLPVLDKLPSV